LKSREVTAVEWLCGDHGGETQTEVRVSATTLGFDGTRLIYECTPAGAKGKLRSSERF